MPRRSVIARLPTAVRREINDRLQESGFSGYVELSAELARRGVHVSKSALHEYGRYLQKSLRETRPVIVTVIDMQSGEARVFLTCESASKVAALLRPLRNARGNADTVIKVSKNTV